MEDNCSLPSLQDMLEDFDASRLEELAESLLADVTTELEDDATKGGYRIAQIESAAKPMLRSMVGTKAEKLESSQNTHGSIECANTRTTTSVATKVSSATENDIATNDQLCHPEAIAINTRTIKQEIVDCLPMDEDLYICPDDAPTAPTTTKQMQFDDAPFSNSICNNTHNVQLFSIENIIDTSNTISTKAIETDHTNTAASTDLNKSMILRRNNKSAFSAPSTSTLTTTTLALSDTHVTTISDPNTTSTDDEFLYEATYDDEGNLITVILPDEDISHFEEVIEEQPASNATAAREDDDEYISPDSVSALSPITSINYASPVYSLRSVDDPTGGSASDHDSAYDSIINSPPGKLSSSWSTTSSMAIDDDYQCYDYWPQDSFSVLFPSLA